MGPYLYHLDQASHIGPNTPRRLSLAPNSILLKRTPRPAGPQAGWEGGPRWYGEAPAVADNYRLLVRPRMMRQPLPCTSERPCARTHCREGHPHPRCGSAPTARRARASNEDRTFRRAAMPRWCEVAQDGRGVPSTRRTRPKLWRTISYALAIPRW
jgi:hypothetical protein